ncbi:unnamed protein product [Diamesa serratosioi]
MTQVRPLSYELQKVASEELLENPIRIPEDIALFRQWILKQSHLKSRIDDQFLLSFLRGSKYSLQKAKEKLDSYWTLKSMIPEFFGLRDPVELQEIMDLGVLIPLPTDESMSKPRIVTVRIGCYDFNKYDFASVMKVNYMIADMNLVQSDIAIVCGHINLVDLKGIGFKFMSQMTISMIKKVSMLLEAFPIRVKAIHLINPPKNFDRLYKLFQSVVSDKIKQRFFLHGSLEELHKKIPKSELPVEYGGSLGNLNDMAIKWKHELIKNRGWFIEDSKYGVNETLRSSESSAVKCSKEVLFGVEGNFRSLNID